MAKNKKTSKQASLTEELKEQIEALKSSKLQVMADFENFRKRMEEEKSKFGLMANMMIVSILLEMLDELERALTDDEIKSARATEVLKLFRDKLLSAVMAAGVEKVDIEIGAAFDSRTMEAITSIPVPDEAQEGKVIDIISSAFKYSNKDEILKTAKVVVGKTSSN